MEFKGNPINLDLNIFKRVVLLLYYKRTVYIQIPII